MSKCEICKADCIFKGEKDPKPMCRGFIPMSVADRVRTMSDEEMAKAAYRLAHSYQKPLSVQDMLERLQRPCPDENEEDV